MPDLPQHDQQLLLHQERRGAAVGAEAAALPEPETLQPVPLPLEAAVTDGRVKCNMCGSEFSNRFWTQFGSEVRFSKHYSSETFWGKERILHLVTVVWTLVFGCVVEGIAFQEKIVVSDVTTGTLYYEVGQRYQSIE